MPIAVIAVIVPPVNPFRCIPNWQVFALIMALATAPAAAFDQLEIVLGDLQGGGWQAQDMRLHLELADDGQRGDISIAALTLPAPIGAVRGVRLRCNELRLDTPRMRCRGTVEIDQLLDGPLTGAADISRDSVTGALRVQLQGVGLAGGRWELVAETGVGDEWSLQLHGRQVDGHELLALLNRFSPLPGYSLSGILDTDIRAQGNAATLTAVQVELAGEAVRFSNASGTQAAEDLKLALHLDGESKGEDWRGRARIGLDAGALFVDPLYLEFTADHPVRLAGDLHWAGASRRLQLNGVQLDHPGVAQASADIALQFAEAVQLQSIDLDLREARLPGAYLNYIQPWLHGQLGDALETAGRFAGRYRYSADGETALRVELTGLDVVDADERFGFANLHGVVDWANDEAPRTTELHWDSGSLYRLALGAAGLAVVSRGMDFELREPTRIPVLDGQLMIDRLSLREPGSEDMQWRFDGVLTPVSMLAVSSALGWPEFGGQLSGMIPSVEYLDGRLEVGGVLLVRAFDGELTVRNLHLEQPFGRIPRLRADLAIENLDLEALTRTFEFGKIEGRLSGHVSQLYMEAWQPVAFDARFATPEDDRSRHRISQKAVDNLSSLGGGVGGALSRTFLGVFEEFPYDRIGLSCTLENGICRMGGVAPAPNGYYIVKGRLLPPRLDVVGYADRVDWHTLIDRLKAVTLEPSPVVR
ncbi:MAG: hypothetical protein WCZ87_04355 [Thiohalobacteraceae bacterium]